MRNVLRLASATDTFGNGDSSVTTVPPAWQAFDSGGVSLGAAFCAQTGVMPISAATNAAPMVWAEQVWRVVAIRQAMR